MMRRARWMVCGYEPVCIGGYWTFMPLFCETKKARRMITLEEEKPLKA